MTRGLAVSPATPDEYPAACRVLFADLPEPDRGRRTERALELLTGGEFDPAGLLVARAGGRVVGAVLTQRHPGNAAVAWPPGAEQAEVADALARAAVDEFRRAGVKQAQALLPPAERGRAAPLERAGFRRVTQLSFLCRPVPGAALPPADPLVFEPADACPRFADTLTATYAGTLDCPELNGTRTAAEVLAGYRSHAGEEPPDWAQASDGGGPVGVVMMAPGPRPGIRELSYLGLVPAARGRRLGRELLRFALGRAAASAAEWLILSVDVRNEPALRLYRGHGFREYDVQDVFLWPPPG